MSASVPPPVSVVIPVRDRLDLLRRAVRSVGMQTESGIEIVIVDDNSTIPVDPRLLTSTVPIRIIRNERVLGAQRSRLIGTEAARGRFVALLDSDDWWHPEKLQRQLAVLKEQPDAVISSRVMAARGTFRKAAPWRPLAAHEKVEEFLYIHRGMLQTSTIVATQATMVALLQASAEFRVHNDTMLFLQAQERGLLIIQLIEPLSYFDDNPRSDRISYDSGRVKASEDWFFAVSHNWSSEARRGFMLTDMVTRYVNTGQRRKAIRCLMQAFHPKVDRVQYLKKVAYVIFNGSPLRFFGAIDLCLIALS